VAKVSLEKYSSAKVTPYSASSAMTRLIN
jgi:hypothetical protein